MWGAAIVFFIGLAVVLYFVNPLECEWVPKCMTKTLTGFSCPGCGGQRAVHAFLHGHLWEALKFNLFFVVAIPYLLLIIVFHYLPRHKWVVKTSNFLEGRIMIYGYIGIYIIWGIVRNILGI